MYNEAFRIFLKKILIVNAKKRKELGLSAQNQLFSHAFHFRPEKVEGTPVANTGATTEFIGGKGEVAGGNVGLRQLMLETFESLRGEGNALLHLKGATREVGNERVGGHQMGLVVELADGKTLAERG